MMRLSGWMMHLIVLWGFLLLGLLAYAPSMRGPFQFDDLRIVLDPAIRERRSVVGFVAESLGWATDSGHGKGVLGTRALVYASILAQWQMNGQTTWPYHLFNVGVHVISAWLVFVLIGQLLSREEFLISKSEILNKSQVKNPKFKIGHKFWLALFGGMVFLLHPLQTQAVAYISQRFESMMGMFYLASVIAYLKARKLRMENGEWKMVKIFWYGLALLAGFAAMSSKEVAVTLPIIILIMEFSIFNFPCDFAQGKQFSNKLKIQNTKIRNKLTWVVVGLFFVLALKVPVQMFLGGNYGGQVPSMKEVVGQVAAVERPKEFGLTRATYLWTQFGVVLTYIRMLMVPYGQSIDHDVPVVQSFWDPRAVIPAAVLLGVIVVSLWCLSRGERLVALAVWWFFITLSVTSSVVPIRDLLYEHRLYLPMVGFVILLVAGLQHVARSMWHVVLPTSLLAVYLVLTLFRANVWASEVNLWGDAWRKGPNKDRTNKNYGFVLTQAGRLKEGIERLEYAVKLNPEDQDYRITLGAAYLQAQAWEKAKKEFEKAVKLPPAENPSPWNNLGVALFQLKKYPEAKNAFEKSLELDANFQAAWLGLGGARMYTGDPLGAEAAFVRAIELEPGDGRSWANLATLYVQTKQWQKAAEAVKELERVDPKYQGLMERKQQIQKNLR